MAATILVCGDAGSIVDSLRRSPQGGEYRLLAARTGRQALCLAFDIRPDLIVLCPDSGDIDGPEPYRWLCRVSSAPVIVVRPTAGVALDLQEARGEVHWITGPVQPNDLETLVDRVLATCREDPQAAGISLPASPTPRPADSVRTFPPPSHSWCGFPPRQSPFLVIIPAHNEQDSIGEVVRDVREHLPVADVVVVNDGSLDRTAEVAVYAGARVLDLPCNLGIGGAVQAGLKFSEMRGYPFVIRVDGDGQHDASYLQELLLTALRGEYNVVIGSRFAEGRFDYRPSFARLLGIRLFSMMVSILVGKRVHDVTSGMMVLDRRAVGVLARHLPQDYPEVEMHIILHRAGLQTVEVPVKMHGRLGGVSSIGAMRAVYYALKVSVATILASLRDTPRT